MMRENEILGPESIDQKRNTVRPYNGQLLAQLDQFMIESLRLVYVNMPWKFLHGYLEMILEHRINIEMGLEAEQLDNVSRCQFRSIVEKLHQRGCRITLHGPFWGLCPGSSDILIRQVSRFRFQQLFDLVELIQPVQVVCHTGYDPKHHGSDSDCFLERSLGIWESLTVRAERSGVPLLLENVWEYGPDLHRELFARLDSRYFGFCLDVGHQNSFSRTPLSEWVESLGGFLKEIHVHDNSGVRDDHFPVGWGTIDFTTLFRLLRAGDIHPILTLEPHREEHLIESLAGLIRVMADK